MKKSYTRKVMSASPRAATSVARTMICSELEQLAREGAKRMLQEALELEVNEFLERARYQRGQAFRGYRNGHAPERAIGTGLGAVEVRMPRVSDVPKEVAADGFQSRIIGRYQRVSEEIQKLLARLYLEGLSTGDFEPVFRALLGETAPLSKSSVSRLKGQWQGEYEAWSKRRLDEQRYVYVWVDGIYVAAGDEEDKTALLCVLGLREDGEKELLGIGIGYRESTESWAGVLRDLRDRGMTRPLVVVGDGALGIWAALREVWPQARGQRCWNHRILNVLDRLPKRLWGKVRKDLRAASMASTRAECESKMGQIAAELRKAGQTDASDTVLRDLEDFLTFYDFPQEHWIHLRTSNPIESPFAGIRLRTDVAKRFPNRDNLLYLIYKLMERLSQNWRRANGPNLCKLVLDGKRFVNGQLVDTVAA